MSSRTVHPDGENSAPDQGGRTDSGYDNIKIKLLHYPDQEEFYKLLSKASVAVKGGIIGDESVDLDMVEDMFSGGLNQCLEWVTVVFEINGLSRGVTHQLVRTRKASFAQQSMRYADMGNLNVRMPTTIRDLRTRDDYHSIDSREYPSLSFLIGTIDTPRAIWQTAVDVAREAYEWLAANGVPMQDARTVCPIATETYIICEYPLSEFVNTYAYRACSMFYPETVYIFREMGKILLEKCPWLSNLIKISCEKTGPGGPGIDHKCTYQGWERVEGQCDFPWALEENRVFKSKKVDR
jgi:thymidylate synthase (FAD)